MSFRDHLRPDEDIVGALPKSRQDRFKMPLPCNCVAVHASDASLWKLAMQFIFNALRAQSEKVNMLALAFRA